MTQQVLPVLTNDEYTVLMIAAQGESMIPVGRWKDPIERLTALGFMEKKAEFNHYITAKGHRALREHEDGVDDELRSVINRGLLARPDNG